jgi:hypothetical protein
MDAVAGHPGSRRVGRRTFPGRARMRALAPGAAGSGFLHKLAIAVSHVLATSGLLRPPQSRAHHAPHHQTSQRYRHDRPIRPNPRLTQYNTAHPRAAPIFPSGVLRGWAVGGAARSGLPRADIQRPQRARRDRPTRETGYSTKDINGSPRAGSADERGRRYSEHHITALEFTEQSLRESTNLSVFSPLCRSRSPWRPPRPPA